MRKEKQLLLDEIKERIEQYPSFILMNYEKLSANAAHEFRSSVIEAGGDVEVVRKRLLIKALQEVGVDISTTALTGHIGIILAKDEIVESAKAVFKYSKDHDNVFNVLCGYIEGTLCSGEEVKTLSKLPGKDQMRAELLGLLEAPLSGTLSAMDALITSVCHCLQNKCDMENA